MSTRILKLPTVISRTGLGRSTIYAKVARHEFPSPIQLSERSVGWLESDVETWIEQRVSESQLHGMVKP